MDNIRKLITEIHQIRDEVHLQIHLMNMELKQEWETLCEDLHKLEQAIEKHVIAGAEHLGKVEEEYYVGSEEHVQQLLEDFRDLLQKHKDES